MSVLLPDLRYRRLWFTLGMLFVIATGVACMLPGRLFDNPMWDWSDKLKHTLAFAALAFWFGGILVRRGLPAMGLALLAYGGAIEFAQQTMSQGRSADIYDFLANGVGIVIGVLLALTALGGWARLAEGLLARPRR